MHAHCLWCCGRSGGRWKVLAKFIGAPHSLVHSGPCTYDEAKDSASGWTCDTTILSAENQQRPAQTHCTHWQTHPAATDSHRPARAYIFLTFTAEQAFQLLKVSQAAHETSPA